MLSKPSTPRVCVTCGAPFFAWPSKIKSGGGLYCRVPCQVLARTGRPNRRAVAPAIRFRGRIAVIDAPGACWLIQGTPNDSGYISFLGEPPMGQTMAHRYAWWLATGEDPAGWLVLHACDTPACVRNDDAGFYEINGILRPRRGHLWLGTAAENTADMLNKGRGMVGDKHVARIKPGYLPRGEDHVNSKLNPLAVRDIRLRAQQGESMRSSARKYGVSPATIEAILEGRTWKQVQ